MASKIKVPKRGNVLQDIGQQGQEFLQGFEERKQKKIENERKDRLEAANAKAAEAAQHHNAEMRRLQQERNDLARDEAHADREEQKRLQNEERLREKAKGLQRQAGREPEGSFGTIPSETIQTSGVSTATGLERIAGTPIPSIQRPSPPTADIVEQELIELEGLDPAKAAALATDVEQESFGQQRAGEAADLQIEKFKQELTPQLHEVMAVLGKNDLTGLGYRSLPFEDQIKEAKDVIASGAADEPKPIDLEDPEDTKQILLGWIKAIKKGVATMADVEANARLSPEEKEFVRSRIEDPIFGFAQKPGIAEQLGVGTGPVGLAAALKTQEQSSLEAGLNEARQRRVAGQVGLERR